MIFSGRPMALQAVRLSIPALLLVPTMVRGQSSDVIKNTAAYVALSFTPVGALPPLLTRSMAGGPAGTGGTAAEGFQPQLVVRYGRGTFGFDDAGDNVHVNAFGLTGLLPAGQAATLSATAAIIDPDCSDCQSQWMFSVGSDVAWGGAPVGREVGSPRLTIGLNGELGFTTEDEMRGLSLTAGVPVALVASSGAVKVVPFLTPAIGYGRSRVAADEPEEGAIRFLLGGGVSLLNVASALRIHGSFQKIF